MPKPLTNIKFVDPPYDSDALQILTDSSLSQNIPNFILKSDDNF